MLQNHGRNFVAKCGGSLVCNKYGHRVDGEVKFYKYKFPILFSEVFESNANHAFLYPCKMIYKSIQATSIGYWKWQYSSATWSAFKTLINVAPIAGVAKRFHPMAKFATAWLLEGRIQCGLRDRQQPRLLNCCPQSETPRLKRMCKVQYLAGRIKLGGGPYFGQSCPTAYISIHTHMQCNFCIPKFVRWLLPSDVCQWCYFAQFFYNQIFPVLTSNYFNRWYYFQNFHSNSYICMHEDVFEIKQKSKCTTMNWQKIRSFTCITWKECPAKLGVTYLYSKCFALMRKHWRIVCLFKRR